MEKNLPELPVDFANTMLSAGSAMTRPRSPLNVEGVINQYDGIPYIVIPNNHSVKDLESLLPIPTRKRATITLLDAESFIDYAKAQGSMSDCNLYANVDYEQSRCEIVAVINDHGQDDAGWRDHTATFVPKLSIEWGRWIKSNKASMTQSIFATFIEENLTDIRSVTDMPTGADMLEMALAFELTSDKRFKKKISLQTGGVELQFSDKADDATSARLKMFERFTIGIPVFQGSASAYPVEARLKFRQQNDSLLFWYELIRSDRVFRQAVEDEIKTIKEKTGFALFFGSPGL